MATLEKPKHLIMNKLLIILLGAATLFSGCELMKKELKKANTIRKSAQKVCDCSLVSVSTKNSNGVKTVELTVHSSNASDLSKNAENIMAQLQADYLAICGFSSVLIDYGNESFVFSGCPEEDLEDIVETDSTELALNN